MARLAEVWCTFRNPINSAQFYALKNRFYLINLDNVTWCMESADFNMRGNAWLIKFFHNGKQIHSMKFYDERLAKDMLRYLKEFRPKKEHGTFDFEGRTIDIDDVVMVSNKYYNNIESAMGTNRYTLLIHTVNSKYKKVDKSSIPGRETIREFQKRFIR
jgi:hypothetical protein|nr:MAG TPA_asm: hypothetical protein [Caudoviricetes sp.]